MSYYVVAIKLANTFGRRVAIVRLDNDGPGASHDWCMESDAGGFPSAGSQPIVDIVLPHDPRFIAQESRT